MEIRTRVKAWIGRHRAFAVFGASSALLIGLVSGAYGLFGHALLRYVYRARGRSDEHLAGFLERADELHHGFVVLSACLFVLIALVYVLRARRVRWWGWVAVLVAYYAGLESFVAPLLARPLKLQNHYAVRDPDHRPTDIDPLLGFNSDSLRCPYEPAAFRPSDLNIVFLGDSFTFGLRLEPEQSFPAKVERHLRSLDSERDLKVANFAWTSASPLLSLRRLIEIGDKYHPDLVALCVDMTDFMDDIKWRNMLERRGIYRLYDKIPLTLKAIETFWPTLHRKLYAWTGIDAPAETFFISEQPLELSRPYTRPLAENLASIHAWCKARRARFVVIVLPRTYQYSARECPHNWEAECYTELGPYSLEPFRFFAELSTHVEYPIHSLLEAFQTTDAFPTSFDDDPHWTDAGTTVAAQALAPILETEIEEHRLDWW